MASLAVLRSRLENDESAKPFLDMIQQDSSRINDLITQMLELAHPILSNREPYSITGLVEEAMRMVEDQRRERHAVIELTPTTSNSSSRVDGQMLCKAFCALLHNAIESREAKSRVELFVQETPEEFTVRIRDDGEGIPKENHKKIFEPFFSTRRRKAGLGLCFADRVIHAHGGQIQVHSNPGEGTEVTIRLPIVS